MKYHWSDGDKSPVRICLTSAPGPMQPHAQSELELMYFYNVSNCRYECQGSALCPKSGELIAVNPGELHACGDWGKDCLAVCVILDLATLLPQVHAQLWFENLIASPALSAVFEELKSVLSLSPCSPVLDCTVMRLMYEILTILSEGAIKRKPVGALAFDSVLSYISEHLSEDIRISVLAEKMHLSESRFYHVFKAHFGFSPVEYILRRRIAKACVLLSDPTLDITRIAQECGFCTASYFAEVFRRVMSMPPSRYRMQLLRGDAGETLRIAHRAVLG